MQMLVVGHPSRAKYLIIGDKLELNNLRRICIKHTAAWLLKVYKNEMKGYDVTTKLWKSGTGGGPGVPENYCNWWERG